MGYLMVQANAVLAVRQKVLIHPICTEMSLNEVDEVDDGSNDPAEEKFDFTGEEFVCPQCKSDRYYTKTAKCHPQFRCYKRNCKACGYKKTTCVAADAPTETTKE